MKYYKQESSWTCGAACMRMILAHLKIDKSEEELSKELGTNEIRGTCSSSFAKLAERYNLEYIEKENASIKDLSDIMEKGYKIITCFFTKDSNEDHYSVISKIEGDYVYFLDPWYGENHKMLIKELIEVWHSDPKFEKISKWFIGIKPLKFA